MITVICGTNRPQSRSAVIAKFYAEKLQSFTEEKVNLLNLEDLPSSILHPSMYNEETQDPALKKIQKEFMIPADKWVFVLPEYNGSFPGVMKLFIDAISVADYKETFGGKKLALIGVASGRAGNLRGLDDMTNAMNYLKTSVFYNKLPISQVNKLIDDKTVTDSDTIEIISQHAKDFIAF